MNDIPQAKPVNEEYATKNVEIMPTYGVTLHENQKKHPCKLYIENPLFNGKVLTIKTLYPNQENQNCLNLNENNADPKNEGNKPTESQQNVEMNLNKYKIQSQKLQEIKSVEESKNPKHLDDFHEFKNKSNILNNRKSPIPMKQRPSTSGTNVRKSYHIHNKVLTVDLNSNLLNKT